MAKFTVYGKKVFVDDKFVKAFEEYDNGRKFDDMTAGYLVETGGGNKDTSSIEMTRLIEEGIVEEIRVHGEIVERLPEIESMARAIDEGLM